MAKGYRSPAAQLSAMKRNWPAFEGSKRANGLLIWTGMLQPKAQSYVVRILWHPKVMALPYAFVLEPKLKPRKGGTFEEIPHLIFDGDEPEFSALCLFDPDGNEWSPSDLIAETTLPWVSEWLVYYELWHLFGEWLGPGIGFESIADMRLAEVRKLRSEAE
tara:strand:+ start:5447 stop:5929 length:483 start_codon:yes stop_codon:yes gene_type:complete